MNKSDICAMLSGEVDPLILVKWFQKVYFPEIVKRFNQEKIRGKMALYSGETIPTNERNLSDVRTRMGLLIEFELAALSNNLFDELELDEYFWTYVTANRFPDLEIRRRDGERTVRIEVKCLQATAEEKSANFDTLRKDIDPNTDLLVVCLWEWENGDGKQEGRRAPRLEKIYVFNAMALAQLRDTYWLNTPPKNVGDGWQGYDLRDAITCKEGVYSKEQHNYGKLMRLWTKDFPYLPKKTLLLSHTEATYLAFRKEVVEVGLRTIALAQLPCLSPGEEVRRLKDPTLGNVVYMCGPVAYAQWESGEIEEFMKIHALRVFARLSSKYHTTIFVWKEGKAQKVSDVKKPKSLLEQIMVLNLLDD
ncbi:hypothetical protein [Bifidobacterium pseudolongum]|uniref:Restriction endonuclease n=1 Tax=Bifidobacterium pseudolongum subsp. globosum TaxID=1690 RepID=A0A2N3QS36_9BIFI|nr:hypothetical protein [Bifidobacterium pseudolongum]PKU94600.1 hypothetical protein CQR56_1621 [Bifidobacterium pseudolongum subsp. globosum]PKV03146.1 hypothetical protein CQR53_0994 [Bifidobacterium pseudolongum subsp. globosum]RYQ74085.1 hypothetical protein PG1678B_1124 [Bifidobacterium pseudolongum subsp. globosum]RYQ75651.1 hypothetical protein PG1655B_0824 [Bifidobacterium pseudolongum subsp. globosum]